MVNQILNLTEGLTKMDLDSYLTFTIASLLISIGVLFLSATLIILNNVFHKFWKPVKLFTPDSWKGFHPPLYAQEPEMINNAGIDKSKEPKLKEVK
jgi:hypothetical protein